MQLFIEYQLNEGITKNRVQKLKHDIQTRWQSRLTEMEMYFSRVNAIASVCKELNIQTLAVLHLWTDRLCTPAEYIKVMIEVQRVA